MQNAEKSINCYFDYDKHELFSFLLDLLEVFKKFCNQHGLQFYAQGGTMLGAVRHKGFIPWDDDIDLAMMREDYNQLLKLIETEKLPEPYAFLTPLTDAEYGKGFIRLCNTQTTAISINNSIYDYNHGIFIDIFPLDAIPDSTFLFRIYKWRVNILEKLMRLTCRLHLGGKGTLQMSLGYRALFYLAMPLYKTGFLTKKRVFRAFTKAASAYEGKGQKRICLSTFMIIKRYINQRADYNVKIIDMPFENTTIPVPETYDRILRIHYGDNYMTPIHEKTMHGDTLFSTTIPYTQFMEMYRDELESMWVDYVRRTKKA